MMYPDAIMDYARLKKYRGKIENAHVVEEGKNVSCGDEVTLYLVFDGDRIAEVKFEGQGCAISQASTNVMIEVVTGKTKGEAMEIVRNVEDMVLGKEFDADSLGLVSLFREVGKYPMRVKCFLLPWKTLQVALEK